LGELAGGQQKAGIGTMETFDHANGAKEAVTCPYCNSSETELMALFGQQLLTVQYYCKSCHTPFEHIKDDDDFDEQAVTHVTDHI
jgi:ring-1,2-phenylacetyl-CoA epoxidase subunit PaaD